MKKSRGKLWKELQECKIWRLTGGSSWRKLRQGELDTFPCLNRIILEKQSLSISVPGLSKYTLLLSPSLSPIVTHLPIWLLILPLRPYSQLSLYIVFGLNFSGKFKTLTSNQYCLTCVAWPQGHGSVAAGVQSSRQTSGLGPSSPWRLEVHSGPEAPVPAAVLCTAVSKTHDTFERGRNKVDIEMQSITFSALIFWRAWDAACYFYSFFPPRTLSLFLTPASETVFTPALQQ